MRETEKLVKKIQQEKDQPEAKEEVKIDPKMEAICRDLEEEDESHSWNEGRHQSEG